LLNHLRQNPKSLGVMMRRMIAGGTQIEPFPCALRLAARPIVECRLKLRRRSVHGLLKEHGFSVLDAEKDWGEQAWMNLNCPTDLACFRP
jgi:molybdopterin-guanine dinucleotide biosynthesis protein A